LAKEKWLQARQKELLPVPYFHIVFTLPEELNALTLVNQSVLYNMLDEKKSIWVLKLD
jgi:hypothetical protein